MNGFLNLLKPPGMSSGAAVAVVKRLTHERVGHAGTLDPEAAGVLPIMVGRATRLLDYFSDKQKEYIAQITFGAATDTQDAQGVIVKTGENLPAREQLLQILPRFIGTIMQRPPAFSAIKKDGKPLYALARQGQMIEAELRPTLIEDIELQAQISADTFVMRVRCGKGTYIRTLCHDIGEAIGCPAHMRFLLRTQSGPFQIHNAVTLEEFSQAAANEKAEQLLLPMDYPLTALPRIDLPERYRKPALNGVALPLSSFPELEGEKARVYLDGNLIGIAARREGQLYFPVLLTCMVEYNASNS